jgi:hypothetical protein
MIDRYAHIRLEAKRNALESLSRKTVQGKNSGTSGGTKTTPREREIQKVPLNMVGAWGFEPQTPTVSTPSLPKSLLRVITLVAIKID